VKNFGKYFLKKSGGKNLEKNCGNFLAVRKNLFLKTKKICGNFENFKNKNSQKLVKKFCGNFGKIEKFLK